MKYIEKKDVNIWHNKAMQEAKIAPLKLVIELFIKTKELSILSETEALSGSINRYLNETSQIREIVYAALKKIKRPAHYSEITKVCGTMFKERIFTSEQIHTSPDL